MASFLHGARVREVDVGPRPIREVPTGVVGLVGTAPMFEVAAGDRSLNRPILIANDRQARQFFGSNRQGFTIPDAIDAIFDQGAGRIIVVNCLDIATDTTTVPAPIAANFSFSNNKIQLSDSGVRHFGLSAVTVKSANGLTTYVADTDYTVDVNNGEINRVIGGAIAANAAVRVDYTYVDPTEVTNAEIIGGVDAGGNRTGMQAWLDAYNLFGYKPKLLIAPVYSSQTSITSELLVSANKLKAIAVVDAPIGTTYAQAINGRGPAGVINFNSSSDRLVLCYPHLKAFDPTTGIETLEPYSQRWVGVQCAIDRDRGFWWSASNKEILGITGVERTLSAGISDETSEVNLLNEAGIVTTFNTFGTGIRSWGNRSAAFPISTSPTNFINIRRTADVIHDRLTEAMLQFIDYPINAALIEAILETINADFRQLISLGAIIDGQASFDPDKNEPVSIAAGRLRFDLQFMPPPPCELIEFESYIDIELLRTLGTAIADAA